MDNIKSKGKFVLYLLKSALLGVILSVLLVLALAFFLKIVYLPDKVVGILDEIIKIVSIFVAIVSLTKKSPYKILLKSALVGAVYCVLTFIVFSGLKGSFTFSASTLFDILLSAFTGIIIAIIINILKKEKINA